MMSRLLLALLVILGGVAVYDRSTRRPAAPPQPPLQPVVATAPPAPAKPTQARYRCDGRVYCSQMHSCEEATWFLKNCPGVKMDGNHDGIPCERQWCGD